MRLSLKGLGLAMGILWAGCIFFVGIVNLVAPSYGNSFLLMAGSIYPGFHVSHSFVDVLVGTGYGFLDGGIGGVLIAWLYNCFAGGAGETS